MRRILLLAAAALAACNTGFEPQYRVRDVRILAISSQAQGSSSADVHPGDTLVLRALVANPLGRSGLTVDWLACLPQPSEAASPCLDDANLADPARLAAGVGTIPGVVSLGSSTTAQLDPSFTASVLFPVPGTPDVLAALGFVIGLAQQNTTIECRLYSPLVVVAVASAGGVRSVSYKQVPILPPAAMIPATVDGQRYLWNLNPFLGDVRLAPVDEDACLGGTSIRAPPFPAGETVICGFPGPGSYGAFNICEPGQPPSQRGATIATTEAMDWQWYVTEGEFPDSGNGVGDARGVHVKFRRPPGQFTLWSIVRDGRGGTDWAEFVTSAL
jgi:hypothetical protein